MESSKVYYRIAFKNASNEITSFLGSEEYVNHSGGMGIIEKRNIHVGFHNSPKVLEFKSSKDSLEYLEGKKSYGNFDISNAIPVKVQEKIVYTILK